jgi:hypothetical protein
MAREEKHAFIISKCFISYVALSVFLVCQVLFSQPFDPKSFHWHFFEISSAHDRFAVFLHLAMTLFLE